MIFCYTLGYPMLAADCSKTTDFVSLDQSGQTSLRATDQLADILCRRTADASLLPVAYRTAYHETLLRYRPDLSSSDLTRAVLASTHNGTAQVIFQQLFCMLRSDCVILNTEEAQVNGELSVLALLAHTAGLPIVGVTTSPSSNAWLQRLCEIVVPGKSGSYLLSVVRKLFTGRPDGAHDKESSDSSRDGA